MLCTQDIHIAMSVSKELSCFFHILCRVCLPETNKRVLDTESSVCAKGL